MAFFSTLAQFVRERLTSMTSVSSDSGSEVELIVVDELDSDSGACGGGETRDGEGMETGDGEDTETGDGEDTETGDGEDTETADGEETETGDEDTETGDGEETETGDGEVTKTSDGEKTETGDGEKTETIDGEKTKTKMLTEEEKRRREMAEEEIRQKELEKEAKRNKLEKEAIEFEKRRISAQKLRSENKNIVPVLAEIYSSSDEFVQRKSFVFSGSSTLSMVQQLVRACTDLVGDRAFVCTVQGEFPSPDVALWMLYKIYPEDDLHLHLKFKIIRTTTTSKNMLVPGVGWHQAELLLQQQQLQDKAQDDRDFVGSRKPFDQMV